LDVFVANATATFLGCLVAGSLGAAIGRAFAPA
jgi:hypothetical protein